ncbi:MAG: hypothetical protein ACYDEV_09065 [Acidiferrobacter sp.]
MPLLFAATRPPMFFSSTGAIIAFVSLRAWIAPQASWWRRAHPYDELRDHGRNRACAYAGPLYRLPEYLRYGYHGTAHSPTRLAIAVLPHPFRADFPEQVIAVVVEGLKGVSVNIWGRLGYKPFVRVRGFLCDATGPVSAWPIRL